MFNTEKWRGLLPLFVFNFINISWYWVYPLYILQQNFHCIQEKKCVRRGSQKNGFRTFRYLHGIYMDFSWKSFKWSNMPYKYSIWMFSDANIYSYHIHIIIFVQIYSDIHSYQNFIFGTLWFVFVIWGFVTNIRYE